MSDAKTSLARDGTMQVTAKEGEEFVEASGGAVDSDAQTRGQQKKIEDITKEPAEAPSPKKARLSKESTMAVTAKEGKELLNSENLGETRQDTKAKRGRPSTKREGTMAKTMAEAKTLIGDGDLSGGRRTRSSSRGSAGSTPAKTPVKRDGTMQKTAKEGKEFVNRSKKGGKKGKKVAPPVEEEEKKEEEEDKEEEDDAAEEETKE